MFKAKILERNEIIDANELAKKYSIYKKYTFVCLDDECGVRMAPSCMDLKSKKKPHFKKYRNKEHIKDCKYVANYELLIKGQTNKLSPYEVKKVGYPSVLIIENDEQEETIVKETKANVGNTDEGVTTIGTGSKTVYEFDGENPSFNKNNKVEAVDRIVDWYLGFPHNRDVEIEILGKRMEYRYFFKRISFEVDPKTLIDYKMFYAPVILNDKNKDVFSNDTDTIEITLLGHYNIELIDIEGNLVDEHKRINYKLQLNKKAISKHSFSRIRNNYNNLFDTAYSDFKSKTKEKNKHLYAFFLGVVNKENPMIINVVNKLITFRYDEVRKTENENSLFE